MQSLTPTEYQELLHKLDQVTLAQDEWQKVIPVLQDDQISILLHHITKHLTASTDPQYEYLQKLLFYDEDEIRITEILESLFEIILESTSVPAWFITISTEFLAWTSLELLIDNFFLFVEKYHQRYPLRYDSQFIQSLERISSSNVQFSLICFISEQHLHVYENTNILQLFFSVSLNLKLKFIPIITDFSEEKRVALSKEILKNIKDQEEPFVVLSILFHMVQDVQGIFETYESFKRFILNLRDDKTFELLYLEYTKPEVVAHAWIQQLLLDNLREETRQTNFIIESSGEHLIYWPKQFKEEFLRLCMTGSTELQVALAKIFTSLWFDEQLILQMLESKDKNVQEALYESLITLYQELSTELQQKIQTIFREQEEYAYYRGLLLGYNFQVAAFYEEVQTALQDYTNKQKEELLAGIVLCLGMQWNSLDENLKQQLREKHDKMSKKIIKQLIKGMEMIYVTLGVEGMNFVTELQSYDFQIAPDDITLE